MQLVCHRFQQIAFISLTLTALKIAAEGGIAEMKALTGDAPYLGTGNQQEQAPEFFGAAAYRQYYKNQMYGGGGYPGAYYNGGGYSNRNSYAQGGMYNGYNLPYRGYGSYLGPRYNSIYSETYSPSQIGGGSGFYTGGGNDWARH